MFMLKFGEEGLALVHVEIDDVRVENFSLWHVLIVLWLRHSTSEFIYGVLSGCCRDELHAISFIRYTLCLYVLLIL